MNARRPLRVAIVNDYEVVVRGLARMLEAYPEQVTVVEIATNQPVTAHVDIALYDTFAGTAHDQLDVVSVLTDSNARRLVVYTWNVEPELVASVLTGGANGYLDKRLDAADLVSALERIHAGETVVSRAVVSEEDPGQPLDPGDWPGRTLGLTQRESEIVALISQGLSNQEIADRAFLSINTVKSYIRSSYQKMAVNSRSQAVLWGLAHGFRPDRARIRVPAAGL